MKCENERFTSRTDKIAPLTTLIIILNKKDIITATINLKFNFKEHTSSLLAKQFALRPSLHKKVTIQKMEAGKGINDAHSHI